MTCSFAAFAVVVGLGLGTSLPPALLGHAPVVAAPEDGAEVIGRRRWGPGWMRGWYPHTRVSIISSAAVK